MECALARKRSGFSHGEYCDYPLENFVLQIQDKICFGSGDVSLTFGQQPRSQTFTPNQNIFMRQFFAIYLFLLLTTQMFAQRLSLGLIGGASNHEIFFEWVTPVNILSQTTPKWESFHYGATARYKLYRGLYVRSDLYYLQSETSFLAEYKVRDTRWTADAVMKQNTIHFMLAPQLHFGPNNIGYVYGGFMYEFNSGTDFTKGNFTSVDPNTGAVTASNFDKDPVNNTVNPAAVMGLGINPRFGRYGFLLDARFTRSRAESVHNEVPRIGRENIAYTAGFTYDLQE
jgi:hypothetical protein